MKKIYGNPCNDYYHTVKAKKNRIIFKFVNQDSNTPSSCKVSLGDTDPLTGKTITDLTFFHDYYKLVDHQIYVNGKETKNHISLESMTFFDGDSMLDKFLEFSIPAEDPFGEDEDDRISRLKEFASTLTGEEADIYEALLVKYSGGKAKIRMEDIAKKWNVPLGQVYRAKDRLIRKIREAVNEED